MQIKIQKIKMNIFVNEYICKKYNIILYSNNKSQMSKMSKMSVELIIDKIKKNFFLRKLKKIIIDSEIINKLNLISTEKYSYFISNEEEINTRFDNITKYIIS